MTPEEIREYISDDINNSDVLIEERKADIIDQICDLLQTPARTNWFALKMILFKNRYDNVKNDEFFDWLATTQLRDLVE